VFLAFLGGILAGSLTIAKMVGNDPWWTGVYAIVFPAIITLGFLHVRRDLKRKINSGN
jgi:hypothetical protein